MFHGRLGYFHVCLPSVGEVEESFWTGESSGTGHVTRVPVLFCAAIMYSPLMNALEVPFAGVVPKTKEICILM
jgi:hypothetical protein